MGLHQVMTNQTSVYLLGCDATMSTAVEALLDTTGLDVHISRTPLDFLNSIDENAHGCLILDVRLPKMGGLQVLSELKRRHSDLAVIFLTNCQDITVAIDALKRGAFEYITMPYSEQKLLDSIYDAVDRSQKRFQKSSLIREIQTRMQTLTKREEQILDCIAAGKINKVISTELNISSKTVEMHRANVMRKMQASNLAELITTYAFYKFSLADIAVGSV